MANNKLYKLAHELLNIEKDVFGRSPFCKSMINPKTLDDYSVEVFPQTWGNSSLGDSRVGCDELSVANTCVLIPHNPDDFCFVYFGGRYAYAVPYSKAFLEDVHTRNVKSASEREEYFSAAAKEGRWKD